jgi:hypothetical protein
VKIQINFSLLSQLSKERTTIALLSSVENK